MKNLLLDRRDVRARLINVLESVEFLEVTHTLFEQLDCEVFPFTLQYLFEKFISEPPAIIMVVFRLFIFYQRLETSENEVLSKMKQGKL